MYQYNSHKRTTARNTVGTEIRTSLTYESSLLDTFQILNSSYLGNFLYEQFLLILNLKLNE